MMRKALQMLTGLVGSIWSSYKKSFRSKKQLSVMKQKNIQQEVLVLTQTSFAQKALIDNDGGHKKSCPEELEKGFWNGLLTEMLPYHPWTAVRAFHLADKCRDFSLLIDIAETPDIIEDSYSINPRCFLSVSKMN
jgi:hypothetical protein